MKGLSVCLEHRTVEVLGQPVELTGMEFDILSLLITNQRRVLTYGTSAPWEVGFYLLFLSQLQSSLVQSFHILQKESVNNLNQINSNLTDTLGTQKVIGL